MADLNVDEEAVERDLAAAIGEVLDRHGVLVNRWVLLAELIPGDGGRWLAKYMSSDLTRWDSYGLLRYAVVQEEAVHHAEVASYDAG